MGFDFLILLLCLVLPLLLYLLSRNGDDESSEAAEAQSLAPAAAEAQYVAPATTEEAPPISISMRCCLCFSPSTFRCAKCKLVLYCSKSCQILHWDQGHKSQCTSYHFSEQPPPPPPPPPPQQQQLRRESSRAAAFPYEEFVRLYNSSLELPPRGLINCGNSCYANAVLQCLARTPPLTAYFLQGSHSRACGRTERCFSCEFENLIRKAAMEGASPLSPWGILSQIPDGISHLGGGKQEDAHEFLRYAVIEMQSGCESLIGQTFGGDLLSEIKCLNCKRKSERMEMMMDTIIEINGETLQDSLRKFTLPEILEGENKYHCNRCGSYQRAKKKLTILEAPNILTITLKRFQESGRKLDKGISFPEILDLAQYMSAQGVEPHKYRLYGMVAHLDFNKSSTSGHYVCYVQNVQNKWFEIDDKTVKAVDLGCVLAKEAYMLFYARCSPRAQKGIVGCFDKRRSNVNLKCPTSTSLSELAFQDPVPLPSTRSLLKGFIQHYLKITRSFTYLGHSVKCLKEKICDRLNGWKESFLSTGAREILIKAVLTALPTYAIVFYVA